MNIAELTIALHSNTLFPIRKIAKDYSISSSQLLCLVSIPSEGINQTNLASLLSLDLSTLSRNLQHLINKNFIIKQRIKSDNRSYHINSEKIKRSLGFKPKRSIAMAIRDLCEAFKEGKINDSFKNDFYFNVNRLKRLNAK